nr:MAG TPA: hypothetical protein [Caudoviricetes sp.]
MYNSRFSYILTHRTQNKEPLQKTPIQVFFNGI